MPDFEQLNFKVEAQDNASKVLRNILKTLTDLEKKMSNFSNFKMPNINLTNQQIKLLNNWEKLDKKLLNVEKDLKEIGQAQKKLEKFEIVPKGKPLFTYDTGTESYIDNNVGVARREQQKIKKLLEEQGIEKIVKEWGKSKLLLPPPPEFVPYKKNYNSSTVENISNEQAEAMLNDLDIFNSEEEITKQIDEYLKNSKHKAKEIKETVEEIVQDVPKFDWLKNFKPLTGDERIDDAIKQLETMNKKQRAYFNALRSLENAEITLKQAQDNRDLAYVERDPSKIAKTELAVNRAENAYLKARNAEIKARQEMEKYNQYPDWSNLGKDLKPIKIKTKQLEGGGVQTTEIFQEDIDGLKYTYEVVDGKIKNITKSTNKASKEANKLQKAFKNVQKFMKSIGRIVLYRAIRSAMAEIKKAIQSSFEELAKFDDSYNETLSKFTTAIDKLNASMGLIIRPFVEVLEPAVESIVDYFSQIANYISYATSKTKGLSSYNKINAEYAKDYLESLQQANNLLSFDKFEVLQKQEQKDIYEKVDISLKPDTEDTIEDIGNFLLEGAESLQSVISIISSVLKILNSFQTIMPLEKLAQIVTKILQILDKTFEKISAFSKQKGIDDIVTFLVSTIDIIADGILEIIDILGALEVLDPLKGIFDVLIGVNEVLKGIFGQGEGFINSGLEKILMGVLINPLIDLIGGIVNIFIGLVNIWIKLFEKIFSAFGLEKEFKGLEYWDYRNQNKVSESAGTINTNDYLKNSTSSYYNSNPISEIKEPLVKEQIVNHVFTIDFANTNNNAIARELAGSLATQFKKQNIKVNYN